MRVGTLHDMVSPSMRVSSRLTDLAHAAHDVDFVRQSDKLVKGMPHFVWMPFSWLTLTYSISSTDPPLEEPATSNEAMGGIVGRYGHIAPCSARDG